MIISAYNDADVLKLTLSGYLNQVNKDFDICVADDGSEPDVKQLVESFQGKGLRVRHIWHEDQSFRRTFILNKAVASSPADRIVFSDSDCIPSPHFVADHKALSCPKGLVTAHSSLGRAVVYHLDHPMREVDDGDESLTQIKQKKLNTTVAYCRNSMNKWLD